MATLTTGEVAEQADVNIHTVRYYEKRGLLPEPPRTAAGYRQYDPEYVARIRFVKRAQELGFTLDEIRELLDLRATPEAGAEVREKTSEKIDEVDAKIRDLQKIRSKLVELREQCLEHGSTDDCLVLHALEESDEE